MSEAKPQDGSTVKGYRTLSDQDIANMNSLKALSRQFISHLDRLKHDSDADPRWIAQAKTSMQHACMFGCRAIAQPDDDC